MSVKILGGLARGFPLATPKTDLRPTSVMLKRKLFDWRQDLSGHDFADICAGSGAMGFEALSRGAEKIILNDSDRGAFVTLKKNQTDFMNKFSFSKEVIHLTHLDARKWMLREYGISGFGEESILYIDPPYRDHALYRELLQELRTRNFPGELWIESDHKLGLSLTELTGAIHSVIKTVEHGDHFVLVGKLV
jgi:16S rRNA (guanine966-N2)-methyltransferase